MKINGEAINGSKVWRRCKEGPTESKEGQFADGTEMTFTEKDIRFTAGHGCIYAFVMKWPEDNRVVIRSLGKSGDKDAPEFYGLVSKVSVLGSNDNAVFAMKDEGLVVIAETEGINRGLPVVLKIETE